MARDQEKVKAARRRWYEKNKDHAVGEVQRRKSELLLWFESYRSKLCCENCGEDHEACLDFHHRNGDEKEAAVCRMVSDGRSKTAILTEIAKCDVLCSNCHRKFHWQERRKIRGVRLGADSDSKSEEVGSNPTAPAELSEEEVKFLVSRFDAKKWDETADADAEAELRCQHNW
jgi:hypothetical protein